MDLSQLLLTAARTIAVYALMLVLIRVTGKREIGNFSPFDLLVAFMLGEIVDEAIYGDVSFMQFAVAAGLIAGCQYLTSWLSYKSRRLERLLDGAPVVLIHNGQLQQRAMAQERITEDELRAMLRQQGIEEFQDVRLAVLEVSGAVSVLKQPWAETLRKEDLPGAAEKPPAADASASVEAIEPPFSWRALGRRAA